MKTKAIVLTPFEQAQLDVSNGVTLAPEVSVGDKTIPYFGYQLAVHVHNLKLMAVGLKCRNITISDIKRYYGLKGTATDCLTQLQTILNDFKNKSK